MKLIGVIVKAHGIKGEVKLSCLLDNLAQFTKLKNCYINDALTHISSVRALTDTLFIVKFDGVNTRNDAEELANAKVYVESQNLTLPDNRFFIDDLIDCQVILSSGEVVGKLASVLQGKGADVFTVECSNGKTIMFPFIVGLLKNVDLTKKQITLEEQRFNEVSVYEN
ncbi:MAG: ribosome maturation factor RimM [Clostridia bacterium]